MDDNIITYMDALGCVMRGESPSRAIEMQEKRGQQEVVRNQRLPKKMNDHTVPNEVITHGITDSMEFKERYELQVQNNIEYTKQQYEMMGIVIIDEYDDLFYNVQLPEGWEIKATDHNMWNDLYDDKGRKRASFFYKAAFYDRDAFINFTARYHISVDHDADITADWKVWEAADFVGIVEDCDEVIFRTECVPVSGTYSGDDAIKDRLREQLNSYMTEHYPNYKDIHAYWD